MRRAGGSAFSARSVRWITGLILASFAAAVALVLLAEDLGDPITAGADSFSFSAIGHRAFAELMQRSGVTVVRRRSERGFAVGPSAALLAAEPLSGAADSDVSFVRITRLIDHSLMAGTSLVIVLPKWSGKPNPLNPAWIVDREPLGRVIVQGLLDALPLGTERDLRLAPDASGDRVLLCDASWSERMTVRLRDPQLLETSSSLEPVVACGDAVLVARVAEAEGVYLIADPDLLNNHGLGRASNAEAAGGFFLRRLGITELIIDETIHGFIRTSGLFREFLEFPLVLAVAHGMLVLGLLIWSAQGRFGKPDPPPAPLGSGKEILIRNAALMIRLAGAASRALPAYLDGAIRSVAEHHSIPEGVSRAKLMEKVAAIAKARQGSIDLDRLRTEAERLAGAAGPNESAAVALALRIHRWKEEMTHVG